MLLRGGKSTAIFKINLQVKTQDLGEYWAASAQQLGITVFADTEAAAVDRMGTAIDFLATNAVGGSKEGVEQFKEYLSLREVQYSCTEHSETRLFSSPVPRQVQIETGVVIGAA